MIPPEGVRRSVLLAAAIEAVVVPTVWLSGGGWLWLVALVPVLSTLAIVALARTGRQPPG